MIGFGIMSMLLLGLEGTALLGSNRSAGQGLAEKWGWAETLGSFLFISLENQCVKPNQTFRRRLFLAETVLVRFCSRVPFLALC